MKWLEFLYYKYYKFQVRVGNSDIAPFSAMLIIAFTIMLYYFSVFFFIITLISKDKLNLNGNLFIVLSIGLLVFLMIFLYFIFVHNGKYKKIVNDFDKSSTNGKGIMSLLFPLIGFVLLIGSMFLKALQNQGKI